MSKVIFSLRSDDSSDYTSKFKIAAEKVAAHFVELGLNVKPYQDEALPCYNSLPVEKKREALLHLEIYNECIEACRNSGEDFRKGPKSLWYALKRLGYIPNSSMFNFIGPEHTLEIYTTEKIQIWRDYNLMKYCTYTLEEVFSYPWTIRYIRNNEDIQKIVDASEKAFHPDNKDTIEAMVPDHPVIEKFSEDRLDLTVAHDYFCPLFREGSHSPAAIVIISRVTINGRLSLEGGGRLKIPSTPPNFKPNLSLVD